MITRWMRESKISAGLMVIIRLVLGISWVEAGWHKLTGGFDASGFLKKAVASPVLESSTKELVYPNFVGFLQNFALPNAKLFNVLIPLGEFLVGLGLILGTLTAAAAFFGITMNFMFMFAGTVSSNPWCLLLGGLILLASSNAGRYGGDYFVLPFLRKLFRLNKSAAHTTT